jgi:cellulose synthase/poly-beta-1,6-N-acetylglucosamine synthase-like glycosyltransferase
VLIPAHNEEQVLGQALMTVMPQLAEGDQVLVVADNCTDQTAAIALDAGASVLERHDAERRGKGYALDAGVRHLEAAGFAGDCVVIIDADCEVAENALHHLMAEVQRSGRSAQARYVMQLPEDPSPRDYVSALAVRVRNVARARGMRRLGLPCQVTGSGFAVPWHAIRQLHLASGNIVEDMQIGLDLAQMRLGAMYVDGARVTGRLAAGSAAEAQRKRWEHGHLGTVFGVVPRLLLRGMARANLQLLALAIDLAVLPLSLLAMIVVAMAVGAAGLGWLTGFWLAFWISASALVGLVVAVLAGWLVAARGAIPFGTLAAIPVYVLWKVPMWVMSVLKPQKEWVRSIRKP